MMTFKEFVNNKQLVEFGEVPPPNQNPPAMVRGIDDLGSDTLRKIDRANIDDLKNKMNIAGNAFGNNQFAFMKNIAKFKSRIESAIMELGSVSREEKPVKLIMKLQDMIKEIEKQQHQPNFNPQKSQNELIQIEQALTALNNYAGLVSYVRNVYEFGDHRSLANFELKQKWPKMKQQIEERKIRIKSLLDDSQIKSAISEINSLKNDLPTKEELK